MDVTKGLTAARILLDSGYRIIAVGDDANGIQVAIHLGRRPSLPELVELQETCERLGLVTIVDAANGSVRVLVNDLNAPEKVTDEDIEAPGAAGLARALAGLAE